MPRAGHRSDYSQELAVLLYRSVFRIRRSSMSLLSRTLFVCALAAWSCCLAAQQASAPLKAHHIMFMQYSPGNRIVELSGEGKVLWEHPIPSLAVMFKPLK